MGKLVNDWNSKKKERKTEERRKGTGGICKSLEVRMFTLCTRRVHGS